jgi:alpha/beta superfamily hydrolase
MNLHTVRHSIAGPGGEIECAVDSAAGACRGLAVVCHPHPQHGGTMNNKVVQTLARAFVQAGWQSVRFNFRGVGGSGGAWDEGRGEVDDALAVIEAFRGAGSCGPSLALAGFSFGAYVAAQAAARQAEEEKAGEMVLVGPSTQKQTMAPVPANTLVIHGEADEVVPLSATLDWARPQSLPVLVFPGVGHFFHGQLALLKSVVLRHLQQAGAA